MRTSLLSSQLRGLFLFVVAISLSASPAIAGTVTTVNSLDKADPFELWSWTDPDQDEEIINSTNTELVIATVASDKLLVINYVRIGDGSGGRAGIYRRPSGGTGSTDVRLLGGDFLDNTTNDEDGPLSIKNTGLYFSGGSKVVLKFESGPQVLTKNLILKGFLTKNTVQSTGADFDFLNVEIPNPGKYVNYMASTAAGETVLPTNDKTIETLDANEFLCINYARNLATANTFKIVHKSATTTTQLLSADFFKDATGPLNTQDKAAICSPKGGRVAIESVGSANTNTVHIMGFTATE